MQWGNNKLYPVEAVPIITNCIQYSSNHKLYPVLAVITNCIQARLSAPTHGVNSGGYMVDISA